MSYFEDQMDAWFANDCKGSPDNYNPYTDDDGFAPEMQGTPWQGIQPKVKTQAQKDRNKRSRARRRVKAAIARKAVQA